MPGKSARFFIEITLEVAAVRGTKPVDNNSGDSGTDSVIKDRTQHTSK